MVLLSGNPTTNPSIETPKVRLGTARLTGTIISATENAKKNVSLEIFVSHPISGETVTHKVETDPAGKFAINIDVETDVTMIALKTSLNSEKPLLIDVVSEHITNIDITYNANAEITAIKTYPEMNKNDVIESLPALYRVVGIYDDKPEPQTQLYDKSPDAHLSFIKTTVADKLKMINQDSSISKERKDILTRDLRIWNYRVRAFYYERSMRANFRHFAKDTSTIPKIHKIDRSYFNYMKDLDLNNPKYLVCPSFMDFQKEVLKNDTLAIPEIAETDISSWLKSVKEILSPAVGFSDGQYYDILVANAYGMQLVDGAKPLSQKQKNNISSYWKDGEIAKILLRKNEQLVKRLKQP
ncbi:MAG: hypothetical protein EOO42_17435 [Flavobacteriales bacterium]|nr:MAG: hypothetical protein EOO42_17435 [Flavobacteriales bacterium]